MPDSRALLIEGAIARITRTGWHPGMHQPTSEPPGCWRVGILGALLGAAQPDGIPYWFNAGSRLEVEEALAAVRATCARLYRTGTEARRLGWLRWEQHPHRTVYEVLDLLEQTARAVDHHVRCCDRACSDPQHPLPAWMLVDHACIHRERCGHPDLYPEGCPACRTDPHGQPPLLYRHRGEPLRLIALADLSGRYLGQGRRHAWRLHHRPTPADPWTQAAIGTVPAATQEQASTLVLGDCWTTTAMVRALADGDYTWPSHPAPTTR